MAGVSLVYLSSSSIFIYFLVQHYFFKLMVWWEDGRYFFWTFRRIIPSYTLLESWEIRVFWVYQLIAFSSLKILSNQWTLLFKVIYFYSFLSLFLILFFIILSERMTTDKVALNIIYLLLVVFFIVLTSFFFVTNVILAVLAFELIAVLYYFFFVYQLQKNFATFIKLKNLLSNYLWLSFITLLFLVSSVFACIYICGTVNFTQLHYLQYTITPIFWHILLIGLFCKIGVPGFHFFKLELYQYLPMLLLIMFSILSLYISCFLLTFIIVAFGPILKTQVGFLLIYTLIFNIILTVRGFHLTSFYQFFALSAVNTLTVCLVLLSVSDKNFFS